MPESNSNRTKVLKGALKVQVHPEPSPKLTIDPALVRMAFNPPRWVRVIWWIKAKCHRSSR